MGWFKNLFKKKIIAPVKSEEQKPIPSSSGEIKKIALIVGHGNGDPGAMGWNDMSEFNYNSFVADEIQRANTGKEIKVFYRGSTGIVGVAAKAVAWGPDLTIELHLNAFNGVANGCEVLVLDGDRVSAKVGEKFAKAFTEKFKRKLRGDLGIKWITSKDRGYTSIKAVSSIKQSILIEPFFIDNKAEWIDPLTYTNFLIGWIKDL